MSGGAATDVTIVGGGLAGMAAAVALADAGLQVELLEARQRLGGRAASFQDPTSGELVDHCQHVSMGCCTNLADFNRRAGLAELFRRDQQLHFIGPQGQQCHLAPSRWLPAPLHLAPLLVGLRYLAWRDRFGIGRALLNLARRGPREDADQTMADWLQHQRQSAAAIEGFWLPVLVSALSESLDRITVPYARQVFITGFMSARGAADVLVPTVPLAELYGQRLEASLRERHVSLRLGTSVDAISVTADRVSGIQLTGGQQLPLQSLLLAVPWRRSHQLLQGHLAEANSLTELESAPITGVHLWFDREITDLPHAVLVGRLSQWLFRKGTTLLEGHQAHYYQVVISASRELAGRDRAAVVNDIHRELAELFPAAGAAQLLRRRMVSEQQAVFSVAPGIDRARPPQTTSLPNLFLAGDWTQTGWPSTMEGAVRSGYLAAEAVLESLGRPQQVLVPDLPASRLMRCLLTGRKSA